MRMNLGILRKHSGILLVQNTRINARTTEMKKQISCDLTNRQVDLLKSYLRVIIFVVSQKPYLL